MVNPRFPFLISLGCTSNYVIIPRISKSVLEPESAALFDLEDHLLGNCSVMNNQKMYSEDNF